MTHVFLFFYIDLFDYSVRKQIYNPSKIYCIDTALSSSISFKFSQNIGHLYENMVFLELKRNYKDDIFYWRSKDGSEVDFVIKKGLKIDKAIQVCLSLSDKKVKEREIKALLKAHEELNPQQLLILTEDEEGKETIGAAEINIIPLWKWLLLGDKILNDKQWK